MYMRFYQLILAYIIPPGQTYGVWQGLLSMQRGIRKESIKIVPRRCICLTLWKTKVMESRSQVLHFFYKKLSSELISGFLNIEHNWYSKIFLQS